MGWGPPAQLANDRALCELRPRCDERLGGLPKHWRRKATCAAAARPALPRQRRLSVPGRRRHARRRRPVCLVSASPLVDADREPSRRPPPGPARILPVNLFDHDALDNRQLHAYAFNMNSERPRPAFTPCLCNALRQATRAVSRLCDEATTRRVAYFVTDGGTAGRQPSRGEQLSGGPQT
jgi:hypothetical protein